MKSVSKGIMQITKQNPGQLFALATLAAVMTVTPLVALAQSSDVATGDYNNSQGEQVMIDGLMAVHTDQAPLSPLVTKPYGSNCGVNCTSYNHSYGYVVSGSTGAGSGLTVAVSFVATRNGTFNRVIAPTSCYSPLVCVPLEIQVGIYADCSGQPCAPTKGTTYGPVPGWPGSAPINYIRTPPVPPYPLVVGTKYWVCMQINPGIGFAGDSVAWMLSNSDHSPGFLINYVNTCVNPTGGWTNASGSIRPAFAVK